MKILINKAKKTPHYSLAWCWDERFYFFGYMISIYFRVSDGKFLDIRL